MANRRRTIVLAAITTGGFVLLVVIGGWWIARRSLGHLFEAQQALSAGDHQRARSLLESHLVQRPRDAQARLLLARVCRQAIPDDLDRAESHVMAVLHQLGPRPEVELEEMLVACQKGLRRQEFEGVLGGFLVDPKVDAATKRDIFQALARGHIRAGRLGAAVRRLDQWLTAFPDDLVAHRWRAAVLQYENRPHLALESYRALVGKVTDDPQVRVQLGVCLAESGYNYQEAERLLKESLAHHADAQVWTGLAICYWGLGRLEESLSACHQALQLDPQYVPAWMWKARVQLDQGEARQAAAATRYAIALLGGVSSGESKRRLLECRPPTLASPVSYLERLLHLRVQACRNAGQQAQVESALEELRQLQEAVNEWNRLVETTADVHHLERLFRAAQLQLTFRDCDEAEQLVRQVLQDAPDYPGAALLLQECLDLRFRSKNAKPEDFPPEVQQE